MSRVVLFLDFDGVTHPDPCKPGEYFCQLGLIEEVLRDFAQVQIVISSSWRHELSQLPLPEQLEALQRPFSPDIRSRVIGVTPDLWPNAWERAVNPYDHRERECVAWLREHGGEAQPWIAIDDRPHWFSPHCRQLLVVEDQTVAFTADHARQLRARLGAATGYQHNFEGGRP
jgi:hypothetical protein